MSEDLERGLRDLNLGSSITKGKRVGAGYSDELRVLQEEDPNNPHYQKIKRPSYMSRFLKIFRPLKKYF